MRAAGGGRQSSDLSLFSHSPALAAWALVSETCEKRERETSSHESEFLVTDGEEESGEGEWTQFEQLQFEKLPPPSSTEW